MTILPDRIKELGEVFTPQKLVDETLDQISLKTWLDPMKTWLEPSCGNGNFMVTVLHRLMVSLKSWEKDDHKRHQHIIENMLYGIDIMQDNVDACVKRLNAGHLKHHVVCADALMYHYRFDEWTAEPVEELFVWPNKK